MGAYTCSSLLDLDKIQDSIPEAIFCTLLMTRTRLTHYFLKQEILVPYNWQILNSKIMAFSLIIIIFEMSFVSTQTESTWAENQKSLKVYL